MLGEEEMSKSLLKAGELAKKAEVLVTTIRFYTKIGLLKPTDLSPGGYNLYNEHEALITLNKIQLLKRKRYTLDEIKDEIKNKMEAVA